MSNRRIGIRTFLAVWIAGTAVAVAQELPQEVRAVVDEYQRAAKAIQDKAESDLRPIREKTVQRLKVLQDQLCRAAKLDEALAIRSFTRGLLGIRPDPGAIQATLEEIGKVYLYEVTGSLDGSIWGTEVYTTDSALAPAAVHMGLLKPGERGVVKVRILAGQMSYGGSVRNGVTSQGYGPWTLSFTIERYQ